MPRLESKTRNPPRSARKQHRQEQVIRLRRSSFSYRAIGQAIGISHERARELCEEAYKEVADRAFKDKSALLGEEMERIDGVIRCASVVMNSNTASESARLHAMEIVRRCSDTKVRWLGLAAPEHAELKTNDSWADAISAEVAAI